MECLTVHSFLGKYYADIMTLFALLLPFLLIFYNQKTSRKSQLNENSERWMERLRQSSTVYSKNIIELFWLQKDSGALHEELNLLPNDANVLMVRSSRIQKIAELKSATISSQMSLSLYFSEESKTLEAMIPAMDRCFELAIGENTDSEELDGAIETFLGIIDKRIASEWKTITKEPPTWLYAVLGLLIAAFLSTTIIQFAEIGKQKNIIEINRMESQEKVDSLIKIISNETRKLEESKVKNAILVDSIKIIASKSAKKKLPNKR